MRRSLLTLLALMSCVSTAAAQWPKDGMRVCTAAGPQYGVVLSPTGSGDAVCAWLDDRLGYNTDLFVQRLSPAGARWPANGVAETNKSCHRFAPAATTDGAGSVYVAWHDDRCIGQLDIYAVRLDSTGAAAPGWMANGTPVCLAAGDQTRPAIAGDGSGGAFVVWNDHRSGARNDIYGQHLLPGGTMDPAWPADGALLTTATVDSITPIAVGDGVGGAYVVFARSAPGRVRALRLNASGAVAWEAALSGAANLPQTLGAVADGFGGVFASWSDDRSGTPQVFVQRCTSSGALAGGWPSDGARACTASGPQRTPALVAAGAGTAFVTWSDGRPGAAGTDIYMQRMSAAGGRVWPDTALALCTAAGGQMSPAAATDDAGGAYVTWADARAAADTDLYAAHVASDGSLVAGWSAAGTRVCGQPGAQSEPRVVADAHGGAFVTWLDGRNQSTYGTDIYAQRLLPGGLPTMQAYGLAAFNRNGQTFLTWHIPAGAGWNYRVYRSNSGITGTVDLSHATTVAFVGDSTWCDRRLSAALGGTYAFAVDSASGPVASDQGVCVVTPSTSEAVWYAVTAQPVSYSENTDITSGVNATSQPVDEPPGTPAPVFQRTIVVGGITAEVYTLWVTPFDTPTFPAMANRLGLSFDCGLVRGVRDSALIVRPHHRGGNFTQVLMGIGRPGEWVLALDDPLPNGENTFWYGYHQAYNVSTPPQWIPSGGTVMDYTWRRVLHTLTWARRHFPVDTTRVYAFGYSMGGIGSTMLAMAHPEWIAGAMSFIGKFDFSLVDDPDTSSAFNTGQTLRHSTDTMWGLVGSDLPTPQGLGIYERMNDDTLAALWEAAGMAPIIAYNGRYDITTGWAEKIGFYRAMDRHHQGGQFYWDERNHVSGYAAWAPQENTQELYKYRTTESFPACSRMSLNDDPGDGHETSGDSVGTINGYIDWTPPATDSVAIWSVRFELRDLHTLNGTLVAPDSGYVDVTPRRTQRFHPSPGQACAWRALGGNGFTMQQGFVTVDPLGLVTVPGLKVYKTGTTLVIYGGPVAVPRAEPGGPLALSPARNPAREGLAFVVHWPATGEASLRLFDVSGRVARVLWRGHAVAGRTTLAAERGTLPAGLYFAEARQGVDRAVTRVVLTR